MKRKLLICVLAATLCFSACTFGIAAPSEDGASSEESGFFSSEESVAPSEEPSELCEELRALLKLDMQIIDLFANGAFENEMGEAAPAFGEYTTLNENSPYYLMQSVYELLESVYAYGSEPIDKYINAFPDHGPLVVFEGENGKTEVCVVFKDSFYRDTENAEIRHIGQSGGVHSFSYYDGTYSYTVTAAETSKGLRLTSSLYLLEQARLESLPWLESVASERNGSASTLTGDCVIINVFANDSDSSWTESAKAEASDMINEGLAFLKESALLYGVDDLNFITVDIDFTVGENAATYEYGAGYGTSAFVGTEYEDIKDFTEEMSKGMSYDNICVLFHFNKHERSYFVPCDADYGDDSTWYYEFGVLFFSKPHQGIYYSCPAVYAHELLHAFGAKDLYEGTVTDEGNKLCELHFETELMRYEPTDISECFVGELTAKLVGWEKYLCPQFKEVLDECL